MLPYKIESSFNKKSVVLLIKISSLIFVFAILINFLAADVTLAGPSTEVIDGFSKTGSAAGYPITDKAPKREFTLAWATYISGFASTVAGALFMIFIIYGGWLWMSASGNEEKVERAKKIIIGASIGLTFIIFARVIAELAITYLDRTLIIKN